MVKAKPSYHHGDLRRALLDAALVLVQEGGLGALSLREAARRAGVSVAAPYHHFADRDALIEALLLEGFALLASEGERALDGAGLQPRERLEALGKSYVRFARTHPAYFRLMFSSIEHCPPSAVEHVKARGGEAFVQLQQAIVALQQSGGAPEGDPSGLVLVAWSLVHGMAALTVDGPLGSEFAGFSVKGPALEALAIETFLALLDGSLHGKSTANTARLRAKTSRAK
ncbi:MAG: TetR/AcrR family transcriptional regulator [Deltaproteobacteria bacterium]|nr:TetR/AcrR family transcriptional regulator [Deltaproteobacteria bacterium]